MPVKISVSADGTGGVVALRPDGGGDGGPFDVGVAHAGGVAPAMHIIVGGTPTIIGGPVLGLAPLLVPRLGGVAVPLGHLFLPDPPGDRVLPLPPSFSSSSVLHRVVCLLFPGLE